jgi:hypothetical protein
VDLVALTPPMADCTSTDMRLEAIESFRSGLRREGDIAKHGTEYGTVEGKQRIPIQATEEPSRLEERFL